MKRTTSIIRNWTDIHIANLLTHHTTTLLPWAPHKSFSELKLHIVQVFSEDCIALC